MRDKIEFSFDMIVSEKDCAAEVGSGTLNVLATPRMVALMENCAMRASEELLQPEETTVGSELNIKHLRPSVIGTRVKVSATLILQEGRKLTFTVLACDENAIIGEGSHTRYIVNSEKFMIKANNQ